MPAVDAETSPPEDGMTYFTTLALYLVAAAIALLDCGVRRDRRSKALRR